MNKTLLENNNYCITIITNEVIDYLKNNDVNITIGYSNKILRQLNNINYKNYFEYINDESKAIKKNS